MDHLLIRILLFTQRHQSVLIVLSILRACRSCRSSRGSCCRSPPPHRSASERINGEFAFVKDPRRNRLGHEKESKLVGLFHNLRLLSPCLSRMKKPDYTEPALGWNDEDFKVGLIKFGVAEYTAPTQTKIEAPLRPPAIAFEPAGEPAAPLALQEPLDEAEPLPGSCEAQGLEGRRAADGWLLGRPPRARTHARTMRGDRCAWRPAGRGRGQPRARGSAGGSAAPKPPSG